MTPEEHVESLYTREDVYVDVSEMGNDIQIKGPPLPIGVDQGVAAQVVRTPVIAPICNKNLHEILKPGGKINHLPNMFLAMAQDASEKKLPSSTLVVGLYGNDTKEVLPGQYVAELHLVIHRKPDEKDQESIPVPSKQ